MAKKTELESVEKDLGAFLDRLSKSDGVQIVTVNGKPEYVFMREQEYQKLFEVIKR